MVSIQESDGTAASIENATKRLAAYGQIDAILIADSELRRDYRAIYGLATWQEILGTDLWNIDGTLTANAMVRGAWFSSVSDGMYRTYAEISCTVRQSAAASFFAGL